MTYASRTKVDVANTIEEIRRTLRRYGTPDGFGYVEEANYAGIIFAMANRRIRIVIEMPDPDQFRYTNHRPPRERAPKQQEDAYNQACREKWRSLLLVIKAKLEAISAGITTFENEFMANIVLPDNSTVAEWMAPQIERAYRDHQMPALLPMPPSSNTPSIPLPPAYDDTRH